MSPHSNPGPNSPISGWAGGDGAVVAAGADALAGAEELPVSVPSAGAVAVAGALAEAVAVAVAVAVAGEPATAEGPVVAEGTVVAETLALALDEVGDEPLTSSPMAIPSISRGLLKPAEPHDASRGLTANAARTTVLAARRDFMGQASQTRRRSAGQVKTRLEGVETSSSLAVVELPGIEPGSSAISPRLLRVQFAKPLLGSPVLANKSG